MMIDCPFRICTTRVELAAELKQPGSDEAEARVPMHPLGGLEEFGLCPASLTAYPLSAYDSGQLEEQAIAIERIVHDRDNRPGDRGPAGTQPQHAQPQQAEPYWFRDRNPGGGSNGSGGYVAPPAMEQVLLPPTSPTRDPLRVVGPPSTGGNQVASVGEIRALLMRAGQITAEASDALFVIENSVSEALQIINVARESSVDDMGAPALSEAIEKIGEANGALRRAMEANSNYRETSL